MSRPLLLVPLLLALTPIVAADPSCAAQQPRLNAAVDSFLDSRIAATAFSGVVVVAGKAGNVYERPAGMANVEAGTPITLETRLELASVTKLFTRIAILQLAQAGRLALTDTVGKFLPQYPNPVVRSRVTVDQLLRHRSGVGSFWNERFMARRADVRTVNDYLELFQEDSLLFEPGTSEAYSNGGYVLLGAIIERVTGMSYHEYLQNHVFRPAGMTRTLPYDRRAVPNDAAIGYTTQPAAGPMTGDRRLPEADGTRPRLASGTPRRPNTAMQPGRSGPAGGHYSTAGDLLKLASALTDYRLLDSAHTTGLFGARYARGDDFRANGGGPGVNAEFSIFPSGLVMVVLSNYDPPAATEVARYIRSLLGRPAPVSGGSKPRDSLRAEIEALHVEMVAAYQREPASVARYYTDDASILGGAGRWVGREQIARYWAQGPAAADWTLEVLEVGGDRHSPWVRGRSTLVSQSGRRMVTDYVGILKRQADDRLRFYIDIFVAGGPGR